MKYFATSLIYLLFAHFSFAQDWALFPQGQKTLWSAGGEFHLYFNDVTVPDAGSDKHYFGAGYLTEGSQLACYDLILDYLYQSQPAPIDSLFSTPNYWFDYLGNDEIRFFHLAGPGHSWNNPTPSSPLTDSLVFTCISKEVQAFFDVTDSVKTYLATGYKNGTVVPGLAALEYQLSKSFGLLRYFPLRFLGGQPALHEMVGFNDGDAHGFTSSWGDYFGGFAVGQKLKWEETHINNTFPAPPGVYKVKLIYLDSIVSVAFSENSLTLGVERSGVARYWKNGTLPSAAWDSTATFQQSKTIVHQRAYYETAIAAPPGWFGFELSGPAAFHTQHDFSNWGNATLAYGRNFYAWDSTTCDVLIADPDYFPTVLTAGLGRTHYGFSGGFFFVHEEVKLVGYTDEGDEFGDVINPVFSSPVPNVSITVFPNPAVDRIAVILPENVPIHLLEIKIVDLTGRVTTRKRPTTHFEKMDLDGLPDGLYFLVLEGAGLFGRERFAKMR